jgi:hypothetical protein
VAKQYGDSLAVLYDKGDPWEYEVPYPKGMQAGGPLQCVNDAEVIGFYAHYDDDVPNSPCKSGGCPQKPYAYFVHWPTHTILGEFAVPDTTSFEATELQCVWRGAWPDPHEESAWLSLSDHEIAFTVGVSPLALTRTLELRNLGSQPMGDIGFAVSPQAVEWLSVGAEGSGDTRTITITIHPDRLTADESTAEVTVTASGAGNQERLTVTVVRGTAVAAPGNVRAELAGDSLLDVALTWRDNAPDESGFIVERRVKGNQDWTEAGRTATDDTSFTDRNMTLQETYEYRIRAFKVAQDNSEHVSTPAAVSEITITGRAWIRVTSPAAGEVLTPGERYVITWESNEVDQIYIELSLDGGRSFTDVLTPSGGIYDNTDAWENYEWIVPAGVNENQCVIRITEYTEPVSGQSPVFSIGEGALVRPSARHGATKPRLEYHPRTGLRVWFGARAQDGEIWVHSLDGRCLLHRRHCFGGLTMLPLAPFGGGIYSVRAREGGNLVAKRIIVQ